MNIICNNCVGARLYEVTHQQFPNPFMWAAIKDNDFINIINDYDNIDLSNIKIELEYYGNNDYKTIKIMLDNNSSLHFIHYIQNDNCIQPTKTNNTNISYFNIIKYAENKWFDRLNRTSESPIFLYSFNYIKSDDNNYYNILNKLLKIDKPLIILVHENITIPECDKNNIKIIKCPNEIMELNGTSLALALKDIIFNNNN